MNLQKSKGTRDKGQGLFPFDLFLVSCFLFLTSSLLYAQGNWVQKSDFGGTARSEAVAFSIGGKGYIGTGYDYYGPYKKDFWEYDPQTNTWTQKADFSGTPRHRAVGFSIGNKGYIGLGNDSQYKEDFWEYNPATNTWKRKSNFLGKAREGAVGFSIGNKGYIGAGFCGIALGDFWEWDGDSASPSYNTWKRRADIGGQARTYAVGFSIGTKGYIAVGYNISGMQELWEWEGDSILPAYNTWTKKADFPGKPRWAAAGFASSTNGYVCAGYDGNNYFTDFYEWNQKKNLWKQKKSFAGTARNASVGFLIDNTCYVGLGDDSTYVYKKDFWGFTEGK